MILSDLCNSRLRRLEQINEFRPFVQTQVNSTLLQGMERGKEIFNYTFRGITLFISQLTKDIIQTGDLDIVYLGTGAIHGRLNQTIQEFISLALLRTCQFTYRLMHDRVLYQANDVLFKIVAHHFSCVRRIWPQRCEGLSQKKESEGTIYLCPI